MVSWPCCFWVCSDVKHHGGEHVVQEAAYLMVASKSREKEGTGSPINGTLLMIYFLQLDVPPKVSTTSQ